ncbi:protein kinase domain-containing protein [Streptomyces hoynatensis]|uniref:non-specific serine/threonine protein kinase n=1 Tax=Streptomyces hoynatensis TaxID=1141874 RepID=A0A3A9YTA5_9ACTN|nr:serine/threonine-protein kinase [Streptomyces hoynatensis]RKN39282.1 hypothetical protein D7294_22205 [Streptomyces hoynatensis]
MGDGDRVLAGRYRLVRPLGQGGMGEVWEAHDESLRRPVAVKVVSVLAGGGGRAAEARARFLREARITAALQHPNIVTVHDLGEAATAEGTTPFLVMELLRGHSLEAVIRRGPVGGADTARWGAQVCDALAEAHAGGVLHRDIKPANLFVTAAGIVKVLDFGIARAADPEATGDRLTHTGFLVGTASYMAPEQARGNPERRSDLYALGCVLFDMLTGRPPFTAPDAVGYLMAHLNDPPPAPSSVAPGVSGAWDRLILRLLAKEPRLRHESAAALAAELRRLQGQGGDAPAPAAADLGGRPEDAATATAPVPGVAAPTAVSTAPGGPAGPRGLTRRGLLAGGGSLAALAVAGGAGAVYVSGDPEKDPVAWSRKIDGIDLLNAPEPHLLVSGGRCVVATGNDYRDTAALCAVDLADGEGLWEVSLDGLWVGASPTRFAVADGVVFALTTSGTDKSTNVVHAFDAADGTRLLRRDQSPSRLDVHGPSGLLISGEGGLLTGTDPRTGDSRWVMDVSSPYDAAFVLAGDLVLCDGGPAVLAETGEVHWERSDLAPRGDLGHALGEGVLAYEAGETAAVDVVFRAADTGEVVWRSPYREEDPEPVVGALPPLASLVSGTTVLLPPGAGERTKPTAVDGLTGEQKWTWDGAGGTDARSVTGGFVVPAGETTVCLAADDGSERWRDEDGGTPTVRTADAYAAFYRTKRERLIHRWTTVRVLGAEGGDEVWRGQFDSSTVSGPAAVEDLIIVIDGDGMLWVLPG